MRHVDLVVSSPRQLSAVRAALEQVLDTSGLDGLAPDALLVVGELVTNALVHGGSPVRVSLTAGEGRVRIAVTDPGGGMPEPMVVGPEAIGGRGLAIVDAVADEWGISFDPSSKTVWAHISGADPP